MKTSLALFFALTITAFGIDQNTVGIDKTTGVIKAPVTPALFRTANGIGGTATSLAQFAATTSLQLKTLLSDETGSGLAVFNNAPTLIAPNLGAPTFLTLTNATGLPLASGISGLGTGWTTVLAAASASVSSTIADPGYNFMTYSVTGSGVWTARKINQLDSYTVATLPAGTVGDTAFVTDATAPTYLGTLTGGGAVRCPVFRNATVWVAH